MKLVWPSSQYLPSYVTALERGWSPDNLRGEAAAREELADIAADAAGFLASLVDIEATGSPITLPNGTTVSRLPGYRRWLWDDEFGGIFIEEFVTPSALGGGRELRYRVPLDSTIGLPLPAQTDTLCPPR